MSLRLLLMVAHRTGDAAHNKLRIVAAREIKAKKSQAVPPRQNPGLN
jgi:hypothetical protein